MSNTVITNYTDLNGPSTKTDSSVVVIVNKDGSLSVDQNLLGTLMGTDGSQAAGISVVRVGHEGRPDDATDSENEDDKVPHVTLSVDSYYNEPASIIKYDSGAEMLQSLRIETRENSLVGFQNDHCYTPLTSPSQMIPQRNDSFAAYDEPVIEITHTPPPKPVSTPKKITILEQQIIPKGKKIILNSSEPSIILKGNDILTKPLPVLMKSKLSDLEKSKVESKTDENVESSSVSSSGDSTADRDSDSDYKDVKDKAGPLKLRKVKPKPRILKMMPSSRTTKIDPKITSRLKANKNLVKRDIKEKLLNKNFILDRKSELDPSKDNQNLSIAVSVSSPNITDQSKVTPKSVSKAVKKDKKTPAHMTALLTDMTSLFSTPDVIRRVSTENKVPTKMDKEPILLNKTLNDIAKPIKPIEGRIISQPGTEELKAISQKPLLKQTKIPTCTPKSYDPIPQLDDASLAQILQDTPQLIKVQPSISAHVINSPGLAGPLSPTLDLLGGLQPEEDGLTEDLLMHVAQLVESSENLQEVIDKQVLGKVDISAKAPVSSPFQPSTTSSELYTPPQKALKAVVQRKDPIEIVRRDGRVITLPPIEAPATRSSKRKTLVETPIMEPSPTLGSSTPTHPVSVTPEPLIQQISKQYTNKKLAPKKQEQIIPTTIVDKMSAESQESWNSEDDPNRLWCICKQPHNNRFMICCDGCEDWFHGKCVNITKAMGQQMEDQGIEWRCPNCLKNAKGSAKNTKKIPIEQKDNVGVSTPPAITKELTSKTSCIVCKKSARASSIYCSDACILKHAQDSLASPSTAPKSDSTSGKNEKLASESRVIVYERKSGRLLAGPNAPTAENLKTWLQKNPTFEVVRPGTLSAIKPNATRKKNLQEPMKIQTTLNFARIPRKSSETPPLKSPIEPKEKQEKPLISPKEEVKSIAPPKTPTTPKSHPLQIIDTPKSSHKVVNEAKKVVRATTSKSLSQIEKPPSVSPSTSRRKDTPDRRSRMSSEDPVRENVRKALQEQISSRMAEYDGPKFSEDEIQEFANDTELELHELFNRDVGMKYKAKYRSLMFNIKDRKNLTLWEKICERVITPKQLVRFSPEELASQELAQWRDKEAKHQLELIKKSEIDLLAASKTYVLKTHKGEEVMETKKSVSTELDPNMPVEDIVSALNDAVGDVVPTEPQQMKKEESQKKHTKKKDKENRRSSRKKDRQSKRDSDKRKSRSSRRKSEVKEKERRSSGRVQRKARSRSKSKTESREKSVSRERSKHRSRSRGKKRQSIDHSRSRSRGRERSLRRSSRRSHSRDSAKRRRSRSKLRHSTDNKFKHRSKSQENITKSKNDSTDSDSIERPKSAMMKESHPEYDPHEPMITSAFSEEDLRKSREDVYEERYNREIAEYGNIDYENEPKSFSIDTNVTLTTSKHVEKQDKTSEAESDQEPTSTVEHSAPTVWNGCINMVDVARFYVAAHEVSGNAVELEEDLTPELDIVGRINPDTVWDYIAKMKRAGNKDIVILKLQAANDEEKMQYIALYSYLSSRNRLGVVKVANTAIVKDFYIVPVPANTSLPEILLPLDGPGLGEVKTHLLISIIIRQRKKRTAPNIPKDIIPAKVSRARRGSRKKSYTPPLSPRRRAPSFTSAALSTSVKDKIAASLAAADEDEAYSPGSSSNSNSAPASALPPNTLRSKMEELNRQIEEQKQQILKMAQADSSGNCDNEAYSPSRPLTPPAPVVPLDEIALPSNLQEILATIKQRSETAADVDMRTLPMP